MNSPCKSCTERHTACHDTCPTFQNFYAHRLAMREKTFLAGEARYDCTGFKTLRKTGQR